MNYRLMHQANGARHRIGVYDEREQLVAMVEDDSHDRARWLAEVWVRIIGAAIVVTVDNKAQPEVSTEQMSVKELLMLSSIAMIAPVQMIMNFDADNDTQYVPALMELFEAARSVDLRDTQMRVQRPVKDDENHGEG